MQIFATVYVYKYVDLNSWWSIVSIGLSKKSMITLLQMFYISSSYAARNEVYH